MDKRKDVFRAEMGSIRVAGSSRGRQTFEVEVWHLGLEKRQIIRGRDREEIEWRAREKMRKWEREWEQKVKSEEARRRTEEAREELEKLRNLLARVLEADYQIDWERLKDVGEFPEPKPMPPEPPRRRWLTYLWPPKRREYEEALRRMETEYEEALKEWEERRDEFIRQREERKRYIDELKERYECREADAIEEYYHILLENVEHTDYFPRSFEVEYNPENSVLIVNYQLPCPEDIPTLREVRYIRSRDEFTEKHISKRESNELYDSVLYQIVLGTVHVIFQTDAVEAISSVVFNGYVHTVDPATGHEITPCVLSLQVDKDEFRSINLHQVDPGAAFRKLKGIAATRLYRLAPVSPVLQIQKQDSRFILPEAVLEDLEEGENIAAMEWQDFEHLIRELFEKEFAEKGGEVKITRASRDRGVDVVVFDPDPLRGGKIVIQAKRYTRTVDVAAVRDLYGTVLNEGATKGILITTSDYGPEAYEFAKGKPIVLLNGNNLLHLLRKHGYRARIDLQEARKVLVERKEDL